MISKMKKLTLMTTRKGQDDFLKGLRRKGMLHIKPLQEEQGIELKRAIRQIETVKKAVGVLSQFEVKRASRRKEWKEEDIVEKGELVCKILREKEEVNNRVQSIKVREGWFRAWGKIDPQDIEVLLEKDISVKLYRLRKRELKKVEKRADVNVVGKDKEYTYVALVSCELGDSLPFDEVEPPSESAEKLAAEKTETLKKLEKIEEVLKDCTRYFEPLSSLLEKQLIKLGFLEVKTGMIHEKDFSCVQGFFPARKEEEVLELVKKYGLGYIVEDPEDPKNVPTQITNPAWIDIVSPVFKFMNTVPGYDEFDISLVFLIFFSLFFAMLVGDAGYGLIFLGVTVYARKKAPKVPGAVFFLMYLLSGATIMWGALTGTWFGAEGIAKLPVISNLVIAKISSFGETNQEFMMFLCFLIGAVHLTIAHVIKTVRQINSPTAVAEAGWISIVWGMFFAARTLVIGSPFPQMGGYLLGGGILLVLVFANFQKNVLKGILSTLADLPLSVISAFSDVVSYLRLFAVGYASVIVAQSFNNMAVGGGIKSIAGALAAALILFFGHALNIVLALMAVVVHGIRLNMLEFSGHLGMQWSGKEYKPFKE